MFIRYRIEPVGKKHGWKQGGPDCWYYAAKSLLRFYGCANSKSDKIWAHLQVAKVIRLFINHMRAVYGKDLHHPMLTNANAREWIDSEIVKIENTRKDIVSTAQSEMGVHKKIEILLADDNLWTPDKIAELSLISRQLDPIVGGMDLTTISAKRYTFLKIGQTMLKFMPSDKLWTISEIFTSAFPPTLFEAVALTEKTPAKLYELLVKHGPLWTMGALSAKNKAPYSIVTHGETPEDDVEDRRVLVESYVTDSSHAVTVYGVHTDSGMVEYADPNDFTTPRRVAASVFFSHLRTFEFNSEGTYFLKVTAANSAEVLAHKTITSW